MKVPKSQGKKDGITIRDIGSMVGMAEPITGKELTTVCTPNSAIRSLSHG